MAEYRIELENIIADQLPEILQKRYGTRYIVAAVRPGQPDPAGSEIDQPALLIPEEVAETMEADQLSQWRGVMAHISTSSTPDFIVIDSENPTRRIVVDVEGSNPDSDVPYGVLDTVRSTNQYLRENETGYIFVSASGLPKDLEKKFLADGVMVVDGRNLETAATRVAKAVDEVLRDTE